MKPLKLSDKYRWILALSAIAIAFLIYGAIVITDWEGNSTRYVCLVITFLTVIIVAPLNGKRFLTVLASLFIFSCLFPPWQHTSGSRTVVGYSLLFDPDFNGVQIDFGRLFLEWAALAAAAGIVRLLIVKPARSGK